MTASEQPSSPAASEDSSDPIRRVVIVGGGTAGWSAAAALAPYCRQGQFELTLVESEQIGIIGVGEATVPVIRDFNTLIGLDETEFIRATGATYKLGIEFVDWGRIGDRYIHPFGYVRRRISGVEPHHHQARMQAAGLDFQRTAISVATAASAQDRFALPGAGDANCIEPHSYAFHFDATLYAPLLRRHSEAQGVRRVEGKVVDARLRADDGFIEALVLDDGRIIEGDLFIDCSGFRALLIGQHLGIGEVDWSEWLPCDRAVAAPSEVAQPLHPYTRSTARDAGWQWRIPLQERVGNGYIYSSAFVDDDTAQRDFEQLVDTPLVSAPRLIRFKTGHREKIWHRNCIAIGLSGGFLEPLESTSIYFVHRAITMLIDLFPSRRCETELADEYNRLLIDEFEQVRDFLVLHYCATERRDTPFWRHCAALPLPDSLKERIALFQERGIVVPNRNFFSAISWVSVMLGQRIAQHGWDPRLDRVPENEAIGLLDAAVKATQDYVSTMPPHAVTMQEVLARG